MAKMRKSITHPGLSGGFWLSRAPQSWPPPGVGHPTCDAPISHRSKLSHATTTPILIQSNCSLLWPVPYLSNDLLHRGRRQNALMDVENGTTVAAAGRRTDWQRINAV